MCAFLLILYFFFFKHKTAYEMRISDWSSDVCSSDLSPALRGVICRARRARNHKSLCDFPRKERRIMPVWNILSLDLEALPETRLFAAPGFTILPAASRDDFVGLLNPTTGQQLRARLSNAIRRAPCRERVWQSVSISVNAV